jgi:hypothetical protein
MFVCEPAVVDTGFAVVAGFEIVELAVVEMVELASPKEIVVDATGVETTEREGSGAGVKTEPR